jgi:hypothetical protein
MRGALCLESVVGICTWHAVAPSTKQYFMAATLHLNCWVHGDDVGQIFQIHIANTESVSTLKEVIKDKNPESFRDVDARSLVLWKVSIPAGHLQKNLANVDIPHETSLSSMDDLVDVFSDEPRRKHLHIVVKPPDGESSSQELSTFDPYRDPCP